MTMTEFWNTSFTYAVIGASNNPEKYGHKALKALIKHNYKAIPINPNSKEILGIRAYKSVLDYPSRIDVTIFVIPPSIGIKVIREINNKGIKKFGSSQVAKVMR